VKLRPCRRCSGNSDKASALSAQWLFLFPCSRQARGSAIAAGSGLSLEHRPAERGTAGLGRFAAAHRLSKRGRAGGRCSPGVAGPARVRDGFTVCLLFINTAPTLMLFCRLSELHFELWEVDGEEVVCVCLPLTPGLFPALFPGSLSCFWGKVSCSFPDAVFLFLFHHLVYSLIAKGIEGLI